MPSWGVWDVAKAGSVQHEGHCVWAPPHAPQQVKVRSWSPASNSYINWDSKIWNKLKNGKK